MNDRDESPFEELPHTADLQLRGRGATLIELLGHLAQGLLALQRCVAVAEGSPVCREVQVDAPDTAALVVEWLNELLYWSDHDRVGWERCEIAMPTSTSVQARLYAGGRRHPSRNIKAATYHDLLLTQEESGWMVVVTLDV